MRDDMKKWAQNPEVKNKKLLLDARRSIEMEMEKFKNFEKSTKTKAYSKLGLSEALRQSVIKDNKNDPNYKTVTWVHDTIQHINNLTNEHERLIEEIMEEQVSYKKFFATIFIN